MNINPAIFRAYDIRGIVETDLTPGVVLQIGKAFAQKAKAAQQQTVIIGRDGRLSSPQLADSLAAGITSQGLNVIDVGLVPTPVLYFATYLFETGTGVMITGSHNPANYNGLKMMIAEQTLHSDSIQNLLQLVLKNNFATDTQHCGTITQQDAVTPYLEKICGDIKINPDLKFAFDCGNGAASEVATKLFAQLNCNAIGLYNTVDGNFPNHHPDPSKPENLADLKKCVIENKLDLGLAFDGDGDRLGVIDTAGNIIWADRQLILYAQDVLSRNPKAPIVFDVKCSQHLEQAISKAGGKAIMSRTGHSFIKQEMVKHQAPLGGEMSGHIFFKERWYGFDDGLYTAVRLLEILSNSKQRPTELFNSLPNSINTPELNIEFNEGEHYLFMEKFIAQAQFENAQKITIDGVRANFKDGWGLVRASNTTPCLVLRFEADSHGALKRIQEQFRQQIKIVDANLKLPF